MTPKKNLLKKHVTKCVTFFLYFYHFFIFFYFIFFFILFELLFEFASYFIGGMEGDDEEALLPSWNFIADVDLEKPLRVRVDELFKQTFGPSTIFSHEVDHFDQENEDDFQADEILKEFFIEPNSKPAQEMEDEKGELSEDGECSDDSFMIEEEDEIIELNHNTKNYIPEQSRKALSDKQIAEEHSLLQQILQRMDTKKGAFKGSVIPTIENILKESNGKSTMKTIENEDPILMIGSKVNRLTGKKRPRDSSWETESLLDRYVKRPCWRIRSLVENNFEECSYKSPGYKHLEREEESFEVSESAICLEKSVAKAKIRTEICQKIEPKETFYVYNPKPRRGYTSSQQATDSFISDKLQYNRHDYYLIYRGLERFVMYNLPCIHHRMIQFQQYFTKEQRFTEKFLKKLICGSGDYFYSCLQHPSLPKTALESLERLAYYLLDWCRNELNRKYYWSLVKRLSYSSSLNDMKSGSETSKHESVSPLSLLFDKFIPDWRKSFTKEQLELLNVDDYNPFEESEDTSLHSFTQPLPISEITNADNINSTEPVKHKPLTMEDLMERDPGLLDDLDAFLRSDVESIVNIPDSQPTVIDEGNNIFDEIIDKEENNVQKSNSDEEYEDDKEPTFPDDEIFPFPAEKMDTLHPYFANPTSRSFYERGKRVRYPWMDIEVQLLDEMDKRLRSFLFNLIGKAYFIAQERIRNSTSKTENIESVSIISPTYIF